MARRVARHGGGSIELVMQKGGKLDVAVLVGPPGHLGPEDRRKILLCSGTSICKPSPWPWTCGFKRAATAPYRTEGRGHYDQASGGGGGTGHFAEARPLRAPIYW